MTEQEFLKIMAELGAEQRLLSDRIIKAKQDYINSLPFKKGDKVVVTKKLYNFGEKPDEEKIICFVGDVEIKYDTVDYNFRKMKKDGTMSFQSAGIYSFEKIEHFK